MSSNFRRDEPNLIAASDTFQLIVNEVSTHRSVFVQTAYSAPSKRNARHRNKTKDLVFLAATCRKCNQVQQSAGERYGI